MEPSEVLAWSHEERKRRLRDFDESQLDARAERMREFNEILARYEEGFLHSGGPEASWLLSEGKDAYVYGFFMGCIFVSHAACERRLAGIISGLPDDEAPPGWELWGLGRLTRWAFEHQWIPQDINDRLLALADNRGHLGHFRRVLTEGTIITRVLGAPDDFEFEEQVASLLQHDARSALWLAYELYFGLSGVI